jgi:hypothetical protein
MSGIEMHHLKKKVNDEGKIEPFWVLESKVQTSIG